MEGELCHHCGAAVTGDEITCKSCGILIFRQRFLGEILVDEGLLPRERLDEAIRLQRRKLGEVLVEMGACKQDDLDRALRIQRLGRSRLDRYARYLKAALAALTITVVCLVFAVIRLQRYNEFLLRVQNEELTVAEVREVLHHDSYHSKFEALRSLNHHLTEPETVRLLSYALHNEPWYVRLYAVVLARKSKDPSLVPDLLKIIAEDPEIVAPVAHDAIREITEAQVGGVKSDPDTTKKPSPSPSASPKF
jgi:hypothetical protein